jgi:exodeoxyribonuclease VII large subunit
MRKITQNRRGSSMDRQALFPESPRKIYTVSLLTAEIKVLLEEAFEHLWVEGEISNFRRHTSGHLYFTLKDENSQVRAVMFRSQAHLLAFEPEDGMYVLCQGRVGVYEVRGEYQIILDFMEPRGLGALQKAFEQLKAKLHEEGLFEPNRKRPLPSLPRSIGIVTSPTGAAIRDMLQILKRRFPNLHIIIRPVRVQGEGAFLEIVKAIEDLNALPRLDLIVLARGGGSLEDLWAFNEEAVARAIYQSRIPVVTGVGHEVDFTIADFVADVRAPTPSAAAELIVPLRSVLDETLSHLKEDLRQALTRHVQMSREALTSLGQRLQDPRRRMADQRMILDDLQGRLLAHVALTSKRAQEGLFQLTDRLLASDPRQTIGRTREALAESHERLIRSAGVMIGTNRNDLEREMALLDSLNPLHVLGRGYSIAHRLPGEEIVKDARSLQPGIKVRITFHKGQATCKVEKVAGRIKK